MTINEYNLSEAADRLEASSPGVCDGEAADNALLELATWWAEDGGGDLGWYLPMPAIEKLQAAGCYDEALAAVRGLTKSMIPAVVMAYRRRRWAKRLHATLEKNREDDDEVARVLGDDA